ncbi:G-protein coupled receptors family 1 profile domain-containing protein [Caenorhabditis elegans]|uniref:G-protein coupled receptors family 1 profile domain-containing protein n=1 Tax=Caenorhabditis elegans TaxID=6239 RepID=Q7YXG6_CAEEL|nr:G-protein coupled receptors family 1 profile domain-containing protein [Caenorhabditis elegans]CCD67252.1 G-protein coupled receptors family 1 profile domain-containing protein [Caenorhabditis elegans]|eukprot:NP_001023706.1 Serpentine Receptor, class W [Caenorhabditis elegans]
MYISDCTDLEFYYEGIQKSTAKSLCKFEKTFYQFSDKLLAHVNEISISSILINLVHFFILTRKPMRTSSINILMAAVAFFDIFTSLLPIEVLFERYKDIFFECLSLDTYGLVLTKALLTVVKDYSRRCSTWLIFFIAFIRTLIIQNPLSSKYEALGKPKASIIVITGICVVTLPISMFKFLENQFVESMPRDSCAPNTTYIVNVLSELFMKNDGIVMKYFYLFNSSISDIIPCILLLIVTILLVWNLFKTSKKRTKISSVSNNRNSRGKSGLVLCVAIMFFVVECPYGLSVGSAWIFIHAPGAHNMLNQFGAIFSMLITLNTCTHLIVCLFMSSQYRSTTIQVFSCGRIRPKTRISSGTQVISRR